jgi:hypothetical protein
MYTGTLIDDLFQAVERAEKAAAKLSVAPETLLEEAVPAGIGSLAVQYRKPDSETE